MAFVLALVLMANASAADVPFRVVVNRANPVNSMTRAQLSAVYMKRVRSWGDGAEIVPVEQSSLREHFSRAIHGKSVAYVTRYWQRLIFAGRGVPPADLRTCDAVLDFVKAHRGAIGYLDAGAALGDDVKVIAVVP